MKNIVLNEKELLNKSLNEGYIDQKKPSKTLGLLIRHYLLNELDKESIYNKIDEFMTNNYDGYNKNKWSRLIRGMITSMSGFKRIHSIVDVDRVTITEYEWDMITKLNDKRLEKVAFVTLIYKKAIDIKNDNEDCWVNTSKMDILQEALGIRKKDDRILFGLLNNLKYIETGKSCDCQGFKVNYCNNESPIKFEITDFDKVIHYYNQYRFGWKYIKCSECGKWKRISNKSNNNTKYCKECAKEVIRTKDRLRKHK